MDVIETEPEAFWVPKPDGSGFRSFVGEALKHLPHPKLLHSVGAAVGGTCRAPKGHSEALANDIAELRPRYVSEHLSVTRFRPEREGASVSAGFMLPSAQSFLGAELASANIREHKVALGTPLAVETTVSYLPPAPGEWPDGVFVAAVAERADCGILLDLHNVLCNARNGRQSVAAFCDAIPLDRVWELHLAGGENERGFYVDAHSGLVEPELMEIAAALVPRLPCLQAITFEIMPDRVAETGLTAIAKQLGQIKDLWNTRLDSGRWDVRPSHIRPTISSQCGGDPEGWERLLGCAINGLPEPMIDDSTAEWWRSAKPALDLYRMLAGEGRASAVLSGAPRTTRLLLQECGSAGARKILADFWRWSPPQYTAIDEARAFFRFLSAGEANQAAQFGLLDAIASDAAELASITG